MSVNTVDVRKNYREYLKSIIHEDIYSLEHSQYSEDKGMFPFHIGPLYDAIEHNMTDYHYNNRQRNKWQIIFIGTMGDCSNVLESYAAKKRKTQKKTKTNRL